MLLSVTKDDDIDAMAFLFIVNSEQKMKQGL